MLYQNHLWYPSPTLNVLNLWKKTKQCLVFVIKPKKTLFFCVLWSIHEHSISGAGQDEGGMAVCHCRDWPWRATLCRIHWIAAPWVKVALQEWNHLGSSLPWRITLACARDESSQTFFFLHVLAMPGTRKEANALWWCRVSGRSFASKPDSWRADMRVLARKWVSFRPLSDCVSPQCS